MAPALARCFDNQGIEQRDAPALGGGDARHDESCVLHDGDRRYECSHRGRRVVNAQPQLRGRDGVDLAQHLGADGGLGRRRTARAARCFTGSAWSKA